ncbi:MAG: flavoprotein [bacterium]
MKSRLEGKRILLGVTGGIAAYKSAYLVRLLRGEGAVIKVVMTRAACEFIAPLTFETLSENKVHVHMFGSEADGGGVSAVEHVDLAKWADILVVAPVTANTLAKLARGGADDLLSTVATAYEGPVVLAPAMNDVMWRNDTTQANLRMRRLYRQRVQFGLRRAPRPRQCGRDRRRSRSGSRDHQPLVGSNGVCTGRSG